MRNLSESIPVTHTEVYSQYYYGSNGTNVRPGADHHTWSESKPDRDKTRKPDGWLYPKAYSVSSSRRRAAVGSTRIIDTRYGLPLYYDSEEAQPGVYNAELALPARDESLRAKAILKCYENLKNSRVNLATALVETQMTADLVGHYAKRIARAAVLLRKRKLKSAFKTLGITNWKQFPNEWLAFQYGVKPLVSDIYGACQSVKEAYTHDGKRVFTVMKKVKSTDRQEIFRPSGDKEFDSLQTVTSSVGYFVRMDFSPSNELLQHAASLGISNPLETLWEETPWSYVVDWILPVGDWLSQFDSTLGWTFLSGSETWRQEAKSYSVPDNRRYDTVDLWRHVVYANFSASQRVFSMQRSILSEPPTVYRPHFKSPLSLGHMANGLSLLSQAFKRK